jgi:hypothetical protein
MATNWGSTAKCNDGPGQRAVLGVAVGAVLGDGLLEALSGQGVLQLGGRRHDPVEEQGEIDRLAARLLVAQLPGDGQPVRLVAVDQVGRELVGRLEEREPDRDAKVDHAVPKDVDDAALVQLAGQPVGELGLRGGLVAAVPLDQLVPGIDLGGTDEGEQFGGVKPPDRVEVTLGA